MSTRTVTVRAPNPSPMTLEGTNAYLVMRDGAAACIDPGPDIGEHVDALLACAQSNSVRIETILVTHGHPDHWPAARRLADATGAKIAAHHASEIPHDLALRDGDEISVGATRLRVIDAPGHTFDHVVFYEHEQRALFTGDVVLGRGTTVVAPPSGDMRAYQATLHRLTSQFPDAQSIYGGHGPLVEDAQGKLHEYIAHRETRERELLAALANGPQSIPELVQRIYADVPRALWPAAARQMLAYLIALEREGRVHSHALPRALTADETAILNPAWETIVGKEHAATVEAELGAMLHLDTVRTYEMCPSSPPLSALGEDPRPRHLH